jgi:hypothetical protein
MSNAYKQASRAAKAVFGATCCMWYADSRGWIRSWQTNSHTIRVNESDSIEMRIRTKIAPPPIGALEWPAGRVMLQWALDGGVPRTGGSVLEIGSGVGTTSIGMALAFHRAAAYKCEYENRESDTATRSTGAAPTRVIATDVCGASLENLRNNARSNGVRILLDSSELNSPGFSCNAPNHSVTISDSVTLEHKVTSGDNVTTGPAMEVFAWDAGSANAMETFPVDIRSLTHIIAADVVYSGGASSTPDSRLPLLASSEVDGTSSKVDVTSSKVDVTSSKVDVTSSEVDVTSSKVDVTSSKVDVTSSKVDVTSSKVDVTSSEADVARAHNTTSTRMPESQATSKALGQDKKDKTDKTNKTDKTDKTNKTDKTDKTNKTDKTDKANKTDKIDRSKAASGGCLAATFAGMLAVNPHLDITLLLIDRFSGPAVAAVAQVNMYVCM